MRMKIPGPFTMSTNIELFGWSQGMVIVKFFGCIFTHQTLRTLPWSKEQASKPHTPQP